jgi:tRNA1(Val) A37 N6-methylase TrmN6
MPPEISNDTKILDFGCGTSVFSLFYLIKSNNFNKIKLFLLDINEKIIGNAIYNCRQTTLWPKLEIIGISE